MVPLALRKKAQLLGKGYARYLGNQALHLSCLPSHSVLKASTLSSQGSAASGDPFA